MSIRSRLPVMASKSVAKTMRSKVNSRSVVRRPVGVMRSMGMQDADELDVGLVVDIVVAALLRHPACAEPVVLRDQQLRDLRILHPLADLARACCSVRVRIDDVVH
jgi:hypothetical protein